MAFPSLTARPGQPEDIRYVRVDLTGQHDSQFCNSQDPGRIWPGKKMAGRMGGKRTTTQNLHVVRIDNTLDLVFVRGCVPGYDGTAVFIRDAKKKMIALAQHNQAKGLYEKVLPKGVSDLPFPAGSEELAKTLPSIVVAPSPRTTSPFVPRE